MYESGLTGDVAENKARCVISRVLIFFFALFTIVPSANAISIGAAPGALDLGSVPRGSERLVEFYVMSNAQQDILVGVSYIPVHASIYEREKRTYYTFIPSEASEEDISSWITIPQKSILISPTQTHLITLPGGSSVRYNKKVTLILKIPKDAEPGYHAGAVNLQPQMTGGGEGAGIFSIGVTRVIFVFNIPGYAARDGNIIDMEAERVAENRVRVDVLFKNTGTTTITARLEMVELFDNFGLAAENIANGQLKKVGPGQVAILSGYWLEKEGIKSGEYKANSRVNYITGNALREETIEVPSIITIPKKITQAEDAKSEFPWWIVVIIMLLLGLYVYWRMD
ncbi:MAG: hypothetical protein KAH93_00935 [Candidatus Aenigmarchaeota archaeon]|nr:hypothetical protein [Candidatus Aenigmarchaeota archaeon]